MSDLNKFCRLCLTEDKIVRNLFGETQGDTALPFYQKVMRCIPVQIEKGDGLPNFLCQKCSNKVDSIWQFITLSEHVDTSLRRLVDKHSNSTNINWDVEVRAIAKDRVSKSSQSKKKKAKTVKRKSGSPDRKYEEELAAGAQITVQTDLQIGSNKDWPESVDSPESLSPPPSPLEEDEDSDDSKKRKKKGKQTGFDCEFCGRKFKRSNHLIQHELTHTAEKPFECSDCGKSFWYKASLVGHIKQTHTGDVNYTCELCGKGFFKKTELTRHKPTHSNETPHKCPQCGMGFKITKTLKRHIRNVHTAQRSHVCHTCGKTFIQLQTLKVHMILHSGEKPHVCTYCGKGFAQSAPLKTHMRMHTGEKPFVCHVCGDTFANRSAFTCHAFKHKDMLPYICTRCPDSFRIKRDLIRHEQGHDDEEIRSKKPHIKEEELVPNHQDESNEPPISVPETGATPTGHTGVIRNTSTLYNTRHETVIKTEVKVGSADYSAGDTNVLSLHPQQQTQADHVPSSTFDHQYSQSYTETLATLRPISRIQDSSCSLNNLQPHLRLKMGY